MTELILDSTWSYRFRYQVFLKGRDKGSMYWIPDMKRYSDTDIKSEYKQRMDEIRSALLQETPLFMVGNQVYRVEEIQAITLNLDLMNELNRNRLATSQQNDYANILMEILSNWYKNEVLEEDDSI